MDIDVIFYGGLKERVGRRETHLSFDSDSVTVAEVARRLVDDFPELDGKLDRIAFAVDDAIARRSDPVGDGSEIALLPPVSGGR